MPAPDVLPGSAALVIIDLQKAIDAPYWGPRNNPDCERTVATLLARWRETGRPIYHVRHDSTEPNSAYRPGQPGNDFKDEVKPLDGETVIVKRVNSAFIGTDLESRLRSAGIRRLVICGATTNHCVETTTRMAGNLGFDARLVRDATWTFGRIGPDGDAHSAEDIHAMTLANLNGEFAAIVTAAEAIVALKAA